jgi:uncharacterized protein (TIGR00369 family)
VKLGGREVVSAFTAYLGVDLEEATEDGYVRLALQTEERHSRTDGGVHEGVVLTMMDSALGMAIRLKRGAAAAERAPHATVDMNASFIRAVQPGERLVVEGWVRDAGEVVVSGEAEAKRASDGELVATSRLTFIVQSKA